MQFNALSRPLSENSQYQDHLKSNTSLYDNEFCKNYKKNKNHVAARKILRSCYVV